MRSPLTRDDFTLADAMKGPLDTLTHSLTHGEYQEQRASSGADDIVQHPPIFKPLETPEQTKVRVAVALGLVPPDALMDHIADRDKPELVPADLAALAIRERVTGESAATASQKLQRWASAENAPAQPLAAAKQPDATNVPGTTLPAIKPEGDQGKTKP